MTEDFIHFRNNARSRGEILFFFCGYALCRPDEFLKTVVYEQFYIDL